MTTPVNDLRHTVIIFKCSIFRIAQVVFSVGTGKCAAQQQRSSLEEQNDDRVSANETLPPDLQ